MNMRWHYALMTWFIVSVLSIFGLQLRINTSNAQCDWDTQSFLRFIQKRCIRGDICNVWYLNWHSGDQSHSFILRNTNLILKFEKLGNIFNSARLVKAHECIFSAFEGGEIVGKIVFCVRSVSVEKVVQHTWISGRKFECSKILPAWKEGRIPTVFEE